MKFHFDLKPEKQGFELEHHSGIFLIGSCFTEEIGQKLIDSGFRVMSNPTGILFNPMSIYKELKDILQLTPPDPKFLLNRGEETFSFRHHSSVKGTDALDILSSIEASRKKAYAFLKEAGTLIITFGTAFYYQHVELDVAVANCHKQPSSTFIKKLLTLELIDKEYRNLVRALTSFNPSLRILFTVSPVKYLKDGLIENNISKSTLLLSCNALCLANESCSYFPAFELVNDDLRDHRFYKKDLAHPNELAVEYVWEKFGDTFFSEKTKKINELYRKLHLAGSHRSLHQHSREADKLKAHVNELKAQIKTLDPGLNI